VSNLAKKLRDKLSDFGNEAPLLSLFYIAVVGFTVVDVMSSFTLPRGSGPFSPKANLGSVGHFTDSQKASLKKIEGELNKASQMHASQADRIAQLGATTSTSTTTSSSHPPIVRERMQSYGSSLSGMSKKQIADKHPKGTKKSHINRMHHHMQRGMEFGPAHDLATKEGFPAAMGSVGFHHGLAHHCTDGVGFHHGVGGKDSRQLPPGLRRRMMARTYESQVVGSHIGKQDLSTSDRANDYAMKNMNGMFGLQGIMPESDGGWTE